MRYRPLGKTGIEVSEIGYGAWGIGGKQWKGGTDDESMLALRRAFELGLNFIDTALAYGDGHSEKLAGEAIKSAPHQVYIATKVPPKNRIWPAQPNVPIDDVFPYGYIIRSTEESLRNLGTEIIHLQQLHVWNPQWLQSEEWRRAFEALKQSGKVHFVGVSINDHQPDTAIDLMKTGLVDTVQVIYNIFDQSPERNLFPLAQELGIGVLARVPFDEGSLTGSISENSVFENDEFRAFYFRDDRKQQVVDRVKQLEYDLRGTEGGLAEIALRFCISHPAVSTVIPGMRRVRNVEANCAVSEKGALPHALLDRLRRHVWNKNFYS